MGLNGAGVLYYIFSSKDGIACGGTTYFTQWHLVFLNCKVCLISPGTDLPGEWALLALGSFPGLLRQTLVQSHQKLSLAGSVELWHVRRNQNTVKTKTQTSGAKLS